MRQLTLFTVFSILLMPQAVQAEGGTFTGGRSGLAYHQAFHQVLGAYRTLVHQSNATRKSKRNALQHAKLPRKGYTTSNERVTLERIARMPVIKVDLEKGEILGLNTQQTRGWRVKVWGSPSKYISKKTERLTGVRGRGSARGEKGPATELVQLTLKKGDSHHKLKPFIYKIAMAGLLSSESALYGDQYASPNSGAIHTRAYLKRPIDGGTKLSIRDALRKALMDPKVDQALREIAAHYPKVTYDPVDQSLIARSNNGWERSIDAACIPSLTKPLEIRGSWRAKKQ